MKKESIEALRARLIQNEAVLEIIRTRAYEIYQNRGGHPGNPQLDWLQAENETLMLLIEQESRLARANDDCAQPELPTVATPAPSKKARAPRHVTGSKTARKVEPAKPSAKKKSSRAKNPEGKLK